MKRCSNEHPNYHERQDLSTEHANAMQSRFMLDGISIDGNFCKYVAEDGCRYRRRYFC